MVGKRSDKECRKHKKGRRLSVKSVPAAVRGRTCIMTTEWFECKKCTVGFMTETIVWQIDPNRN